MVEPTIKGRPVFSKSILGNFEIFFVLGILTLYALEFLGIHTFSQLFSDDVSQLTLLSFQAGNDFIEVPQIVLITFVPVIVIIIIYFAVIKPRLRKRKR